MQERIESIRRLNRNGQRVEAQELCRELIVRHPGSEVCLMQMLALEPSPREEVTILEALLQYHPDHRWADRLSERLKGMRMMITMNELVHEGDAALPAGDAGMAVHPAKRLGELLVDEMIITDAQLSAALHLQARQTASGEPQRLGMVLIRMEAITPDQLAWALSMQVRNGRSEFGDFLLRRGAITGEQLRKALAQQAVAAQQVEERFQERWQAWDRAQVVRRLTGEMPTPAHHGPCREAIPRLGEILVEFGYLAADQLDGLLAEHEEFRRREPA